MYCPFSFDKREGEEKEGQFGTFCDSPFNKEYKKNNSFYTKIFIFCKFTKKT